MRSFPSGVPYLSQSVWDCQREISSLHSHHVTSVDMFVLGRATFGLHPRVHLPCGRWRCSSTRLKRTGSQTRRRCDSRPRSTWTIASPSFRPTAPRSPRCICTAPRGTRRGTRAVEFPWWVAPAITAQPAESVSTSPRVNLVWILQLKFSFRVDMLAAFAVCCGEGIRRRFSWFVGLADVAR